MNNKRQNEIVLIQITDTHIFTNQNETFDGINTSDSLTAVLDQINEDFPTFNYMIVTGDLVQEPEVIAYQNLQKIMSTVNKPVFYLAGNHDEPAMMKGIFAESYTSIETLNNWSVVFLNSHKPASHGGMLSRSELDKLTRNLIKAKETNVLLCLHHHPVSIESEWMDGMMLENADELFEIVDDYQNVKGIIWGHIHQEFSGQRNGVQLMGTPSTGAQFIPGAKQFGTDNMQPGYRWLKLHPNGDIKTGVERLRTPHYLVNKPD